MIILSPSQKNHSPCLGRLKESRPKKTTLLVAVKYATESHRLDKYACGFFKDALNGAKYLGKEMLARYYAARI